MSNRPDPRDPMDVADLPVLPATVRNRDGQDLDPRATEWRWRNLPETGRVLTFNWTRLVKQPTSLSPRAIHQVKLYLAHCFESKSAATVANYASIFMHFATWLARPATAAVLPPHQPMFGWTDLDEAVARAYLIYCTYHMGQRGMAFGQLRTFYAWGVGQGLPDFDPPLLGLLRAIRVPGNPTGHHTRFRTPQKGPISVSERDLIARAIKLRVGSDRDRAIVAFYLDLGRNLSVPLGMRNKDLQIDESGSGCRYSVTLPLLKKRTADRPTEVMQISPGLGELLVKLQEGGPDASLFHWLNPSRPDQSIQHAMNRFIAAARILDTHSRQRLHLTPRRFRYRYATDLAIAGQSEEEIGAALGHGDGQTARVYINSTPADAQSAAAAIDPVLELVVARALGKPGWDVTSPPLPCMGPVRGRGGTSAPTVSASVTRSRTDEAVDSSTTSEAALLPGRERPIKDDHALVIEQLVELARKVFGAEWAGVRTQSSFGDLSWDLDPARPLRVEAAGHRLWFTRHGYLTERLPSDLGNMVRAWMVLDPKSISGMTWRVRGVRILWESILARGRGLADTFRWSNITNADLQQAEVWMETRGLSRNYIHGACSEMLRFLRFLAARGICRQLEYGLRTVSPTDYELHTLEGQESCRVKLPTLRAVEGLADIYRVHATEPSDRLRIAACMVLLATGFRIGELLTLPADCEYEEMWNGRVCYGLRYYQEKISGAEKGLAIRWLTPAGEELARRAIAEIRTITKPFRERARVLEQHPDRVPLPGVAPGARLRPDVIARLLGRASGSRDPFTRMPEQPPRHRDETGIFYHAADIEHWLLAQRERHLWTVDRRDGTYQWLSGTLLIVPRHFFHKGIRTNPLLIRPLLGGDVRNFLSTLRRARSAFERFGISEEDNTWCKAHPHQFRHWLDSVATRGGLPRDVRTRWMGRRNPNHTPVYEHLTMEEHLDANRVPGLDAAMEAEGWFGAEA